MFKEEIPGYRAVTLQAESLSIFLDKAGRLSRKIERDSDRRVTSLYFNKKKEVRWSRRHKK